MNIIRHFLLAYSAPLASFSYTLFIIPLLYRGLGQDGWVLFSVLLGAISFASVFDFGYTQILPREVIRLPESSFLIYRKFLKVAWGFGLVFALAFGGYFSGNSDNRFMFGAVVGCSIFFVYVNIPSVAYLQSSRKNFALTLISLGGVFLRALAAVALYYSNMLEFFWFSVVFVFSYFFEAFLNISVAYKSRLSHSVRYEKLKLRELVVRVLAMLSGALLSQADRLAMYFGTSPDVYGDYLLISTFCLLFLSIQYPFLRYMLPRWNGLLVFLGRRVWFICVGYLFFGALFVLFSANLFFVWSGLEYNQVFSSCVMLMALGVFVQSIYNYCYQYLVLNGFFDLIFKINVFSGFVVLLVAWFCEKTIFLGPLIWISFASSQLLCFFYAKFRVINVQA